MKVNRPNYKEVVPKKEQDLLCALFDDLDEINERTNKKLFIDWQDFHNDCSPEWTDPCPDYYGYYTLRFEEEPYEIVGVEMTLDDLDSALCLLSNYTSYVSTSN